MSCILGNDGHFREPAAAQRAGDVHPVEGGKRRHRVVDTTVTPSSQAWHAHTALRVLAGDDPVADLDLGHLRSDGFDDAHQAVPQDGGARDGHLLADAEANLVAGDECLSHLRVARLARFYPDHHASRPDGPQRDLLHARQVAAVLDHRAHATAGLGASGDGRSAPLGRLCGESTTSQQGRAAADGSCGALRTLRRDMDASNGATSGSL